LIIRSGQTDDPAPRLCGEPLALQIHRQMASETRVALSSIGVRSRLPAGGRRIRTCGPTFKEDSGSELEIRGFPALSACATGSYDPQTVTDDAARGSF
jgi:hypothetical protein